MIKAETAGQTRLNQFFNRSTQAGERGALIAPGYGMEASSGIIPHISKFVNRKFRASIERQLFGNSERLAFLYFPERTGHQTQITVERTTIAEEEKNKAEQKQQLKNPRKP